MAYITTGKSWAGGYYLQWRLDVWQVSQDIARNETTVKWEAELLGGSGAYQSAYNSYVKVIVNGSQVLRLGAKTYRKGEKYNDTLTIKHNSDGKKSISYRIEARLLSKMSASGSYSLTDIPRKAVFTRIYNLNDNDKEIYFKYSNPAGNYVQRLEFTVHLTGSENSHLPWIDLSKTGSSYTYNFTEEHKEIFKRYLGNKKENQVTYVLKTTIGGKEYYDIQRKNFYLTKTSAPILSGSLAYTNLDNSLPDNKIFNLRNNIKIDFTGDATAKTGTSIKSLNLKINDKVLVNSPDNKTFNVGYINATGWVRGEIVAVDGRGFQSQKITIDLYIYNYKRPVVFLEANRKNNFENETEIKIKGNITPLKINETNFNEITQIYYTINELKNDINYKTIDNVGNYDIPAFYKNISNSEKATVTVYVSDKFTTSTSSVELAEGKGIFHINTNDEKLYNNGEKLLIESDLKNFGNFELITKEYALYMTKDQYVNLDKNITDLSHGIVIVWSEYQNGIAQNYGWCYTFVPKFHVLNGEGQGINCQVGNYNFDMQGTKYVYVYNNKIVGNADNNLKGGSSRYVLRYVLGV